MRQTNTTSERQTIYQLICKQYPTVYNSLVGWPQKGHVFEVKYMGYDFLDYVIVIYWIIE